MPPRAMALFSTFAFLLLMAVVLFGSAGRFDVLGFWLYIAVFVAVSAVALVLVDPTLADERLRPGGQPLDLRYRLALLWPVVHWAVAGLDRGRYHWSDTVPLWLQVVAFILFAASWALLVWAAHENRFASSVVRIQEERGHHVVATGPYAFIRHPMYLAGPIVFLTSGMALGSWLAVAVAVPAVPLLLWRAVVEDHFLRASLPGYREYAEDVPYRLLPGVW